MARQATYDPPSAARRLPVGRGNVSPVASEATRVSGPAAAVVLAAGLAAFALGLLSVLTESSASVSSALTLSDRTGDLSGVTTGAPIVFFAAWAVLAIAWRRANPSLARVAAVTGVLTGLGLLGTFPPFFNAITG